MRHTMTIRITRIKCYQRLVDVTSTMNRDDDNEQRRHTFTRDHGFKQCDQCERAARNYKIGTDICPIIEKKKKIITFYDIQRRLLLTIN